MKGITAIMGFKVGDRVIAVKPGRNLNVGHSDKVVQVKGNQLKVSRLKDWYNEERFNHANIVPKAPSCAKGDKGFHPTFGEVEITYIWSNSVSAKCLATDVTVHFPQTELTKVPDDAKYESIFELWKDDKKEGFARCGHEHDTRREAGQCARHYGNKIREQFGDDYNILAKSLTIAGNVRNIKLVSDMWGTVYSPGEPAPEPVKNNTIPENTPKSDKKEQALELLASLMKDDTLTEEQIRAIVRNEASKINKYIPELVKLQTPKKVIEPKDGEIQHPEYKRLARWINGSVTRVWIFGPAGTGKTHACVQIADALELPYYLQPRVADEYQLSGFKDAHGNYHATQIYRWAHDPNPRAILILDEVDRNLDVVNIWYNAALANNIIVFPDGPVTVEPSKLVIATANTVGHGNSIRYSAAQSQDAALLDRFALKLPWNICEKTERLVAISKYPYDKTEQTIDASHRVRKQITSIGLEFEWGPRRTYAAVEAVVSGEKMKDAFLFAGINEIEDYNTKRKLLDVV